MMPGRTVVTETIRIGDRINVAVRMKPLTMMMPGRTSMLMMIGILALGGPIHIVMMPVIMPMSGRERKAPCHRIRATAMMRRALHRKHQRGQERNDHRQRYGTPCKHVRPSYTSRRRKQTYINDNPAPV